MNADEQAVRRLIRKHIVTRIDERGMDMREVIDHVETEALTADVIAWADRREKRHQEDAS